jgi:hypothetical protein
MANGGNWVVKNAHKCKTLQDLCVVLRQTDSALYGELTHTSMEFLMIMYIIRSYSNESRDKLNHIMRGIQCSAVDEVFNGSEFECGLSDQIKRFLRGRVLT